jgi:hypothetical protein
MPVRENKKMTRKLRVIVPFMPVILAGMILLSCHRDRNLNPEEALDVIKVLNSDITNLSDGIRGSDVFYGINFILSNPASPLSIENGLPAKWMKDSIAEAMAFKGIYLFDSTGSYNKENSENIEIKFPGQNSSLPLFEFLLKPFTCQEGYAGFCFPLEMQASMKKSNKEILTFNERSKLEDEWPEHLSIVFSGKDFSGEAKVDRTRKGNEGTLDLILEFKSGNKHILSGAIHYQIGYNGKQVYFNSYEPDIQVFNVLIRGKLDYGKVDPTSTDYIKSFNDNSHIYFTNARNRKIIGKLGLGMDKSGELLEWGVYPEKGPMISFYDNVILFRKLMDYKYPNKKKEL